MISSGTKARLALFLLFSFIYGVLVFDHVLWRDEALPIELVRNNPALTDFVRAMRYEGIPGAWHFILWVSSKCVPLTPFTAACIHYTVAEAFIAVVLFLLPVPLAYRVAILLLEPSLWNVFNIRQYLLGALCIMLFTAIYRAREVRFRQAILCAALALLAQTSVHGMLVAAALFIFLAANEWRLENRWSHFYWIVIAGMVLAAAQLATPPDLIRGMGGWHTELSWSRAIATFKTATTLILLDRPVLIAGFLALIFLVFRRGWHERRFESCLALVLLSGLYAFFYIVGYGKFSGPRHYWTLTYAIIAFLIILYPGEKAGVSRLARLAQIAALVMTTWYFFQIMPQAVYNTKSHSRNAARFLDSHFPDKTVLSNSEVYEAPVRLYRNTHPPEFALGRQAFVRYTVWNDFSVDFAYNPKAQHISLADTRDDLLRTDPAILDSEPVVILSGVEIVNDIPADANGMIPIGAGRRLVPVALFDGSMNENYRVYLLRKNQP